MKTESADKLEGPTNQSRGWGGVYQREKDEMKTLAEHEAGMIEAYEMLSSLPQRNGIACPMCGKELVDSNPKAHLLVSPPRLNVHCPACDWSGSRLA